MSIKISVVVITYNQKSKVMRCLDSLLRSHKIESVELIVADDASIDGTQETVGNWLESHASKFAGTVFIRNQNNKGTVANVISAVSSSHAPFIKLIAGDDWFCDGALDYLQAFSSSCSFDVAFSPVLLAKESTIGEAYLTSDRLEASKRSDFFNLSSNDQFNLLALNDLLPAPGSFFTRSFWEKIRLEKYGMVFEEDWPMWMLGVLQGAVFVRINEPIVVYLHHEASVFQNVQSPVFRQVMKDIVCMYKSIVFPNRDRLSKINLVRAYACFLLFRLLSVVPLSPLHIIKKYSKKSGDVRGKASC